MAHSNHETDGKPEGLSAFDLLKQLQADMDTAEPNLDETPAASENVDTAASAPKVSDRQKIKYHFHTEKKSKFEEKRRLAKMAGEVSELITEDMSDEEVETVIRQYLSDKKTAKEEPAPTPEAEPASAAPVTSDVADTDLPADDAEDKPLYDVTQLGADVFDGDPIVVENPIPVSEHEEASVYLEEEIAEYPDFILDLAHEKEEENIAAAAQKAAEEELIAASLRAEEEAREKEEEEQKAAAREKAEQEIGFEELATEQEEDSDRSYEEFMKFLEEKGTDDADDDAMNDLLGTPGADAEGEASAVELPLDENTAEFDKTDIDLMTAFGMDDETRQSLDRADADRLQAELDARGSDSYVDMVAKTKEKSVRRQRSEYVSPSQNKEIFAEYKQNYNVCVWKLIAGFLLLVLSFLYENGPALGISMPDVFSPDAYQTIYVLIDFQFVLLACGLVWRPMWAGLGTALRKQPSVGTVTGIAFLITLIHTVLTLVLAPAATIHLYFFPVVFTAFFQQVFELFTLKREIMSFKIASSKKIKYCVEPLDRKDARQELETFAEYLPDAPEMYKVRRSAFVDGFYDRCDSYPRYQRVLRILIPLAIICGLAFAAANYIMSSDLYTALTTGFVCCMMILPASAAIAFGLPGYRASRLAYNIDSAIIGECSPAEYSNATVVSFTDRDVFPAWGVKVRSVKVYGNNRIDHIIFNAASIFAKLGGPLADVFRIATAEIGRSEDIEIRRVEENGIEAAVSGRTVIIGKASYMTRYGYKITLTAEEEEMEQSYDTSILFMAYETEMAAKMFIQYSVDDGFETILKELYRQGMCVAIKTSDPNINDGMVAAKINLSRYPVKVLRQNGDEATDGCGNVNLAADRTSSGVISKSSAKSVLQTLAMCDKVLRCIKRNTTLKLLSIFFGMAIVAVMVVLSFPITFASALIVVYHLLFMIPMYLGTRFSIR